MIDHSNQTHNCNQLQSLPYGQELESNVATQRDVPAIVRLTKQFHEECWPTLPFDPIYFSNTAAQIIDADAGIILLHRTGNRITGYLTGWLSPYPAAQMVQANELFWFCEKEHRSTGAIRLLHHYIAWAKANEAKVIYAGAIGNRANGVYAKLGFTQVETHWARVV